jgi:hypothetical protein
VQHPPLDLQAQCRCAFLETVDADAFSVAQNFDQPPEGSGRQA